MNELVPVVVACPCEGTPHDEDTISLYAEVPIQLGAAAFGMMDAREAANVAELLGHLAPMYLHFGIAAWTLKGPPDKHGQRELLEVTRENIDDRITWATCAWPVVNKANELYAGALTAPLAPRPRKRSPAGPTEQSTSPIPLSGRKRRTRSEPSSQPDSAGTQFEDQAL